MTHPARGRRIGVASRDALHKTHRMGTRKTGREILRAKGGPQDDRVGRGAGGTYPPAGGRSRHKAQRQKDAGKMPALPIAANYGQWDTAREVVGMRHPKRNWGRGDVTLGEWLFGGGTFAAAIVVSILANLAPKGQDALVITVVLFTAVLTALRAAWHETMFWVGFASVLLVHIVAVYFITRALPPMGEGPRGLLFILTGLAEGRAIVLLLLRIVGDRTSQAPKIESEPRTR